MTPGLFAGVVIALAVERLERLMVFLFIAFRSGAAAWEYQLGRRSLWYLAGAVFNQLLVGGRALAFLSGRRAPLPKAEEDQSRP